ncbi:MAG: MFS transporter [Promethearchaeota archaeon]
MMENLEERVPKIQKFSLAFGGFANGILSGLPFANLTFFYEEKLGLDKHLIGYAWLIFAIWNTLNDPLFSHVIDNTRTKLGRRIPYIRYGAILYGLSFIFCWFPIAPHDLPENAPLLAHIPLFLNLLLALFFLDTMFTIVGCCFFSLPNEIAVTAKQRASIMLYSSVFMFLNLIIGIGLPIYLLTGNETGLNPLFQPVMTIIGISCTLILFITSYGIKENMFAQMQEREGFIEGLKSTLKNKPFWIIMVGAFCISLIIPLVQTGILYYIDYVIAGQNIMVFLVTFVLMLVIGLPFNLKLLERWQVKKTAMLTYSLFTISFILMFILGFNAILAAIPFGLFGFSFAGALLSNAVMMGDCIDNDELITGKRREAIYGGVNAIVTKPGVSLANWGFLEIIHAFGFKSPIKVGNTIIKQTQTSMAIIGIMFALTILSAIGTLITAIAIKWYPLDGPEWMKKKKLILKLHEKKEKEYLSRFKNKRKNNSNDDNFIN